MDPTTCYLQLLQARKDKDDDLAFERASDLREWLEKRGFPPIGYSLSDVLDTISITLD